MKKEIIKTMAASIITIGFLAGIAFAHTSGATLTQQKMHGYNVMSHKGMYQGNMQQKEMYRKNMGQGGMKNDGGGIMGGGGGMMGGMVGGYQGGYRGNWWGNMGRGGMMGGAMMNRMTPDQQKNFMNQTTELRKQMMELRFAYRDAMRKHNTTPGDLAKIEKKMIELRTKMLNKIEKMHIK